MIQYFEAQSDMLKRDCGLNKSHNMWPKWRIDELKRVLQLLEKNRYGDRFNSLRRQTCISEPGHHLSPFMYCRLFGSKPSPKHVVTNYQLAPQNQSNDHFYPNIKPLFHTKALNSVIDKISPIILSPDFKVFIFNKSSISRFYKFSNPQKY